MRRLSVPRHGSSTRCVTLSFNGAGKAIVKEKEGRQGRSGAGENASMGGLSLLRLGGGLGIRRRKGRRKRRRKKNERRNLLERPEFSPGRELLFITRVGQNQVERQEGTSNTLQFTPESRAGSY